MKNPIYLLLFYALFFSACGDGGGKNTNQNQQDTIAKKDTIQQTLTVLDQDSSALQNLNEVYTNARIGWTMDVPKGWTRISDEQLKADYEQADALIGAPKDDQVAGPVMEYMLTVQKDEYTQLSSMIERYTESYAGEYDEIYKDIKNNHYISYTSQGINIDTASGVDVLDGIKFRTFNTTFYDENHMYIFNSLMYSALHNGYDITFTISYRSPADKEYLLGLLRKSTFRK